MLFKISFNNIRKSLRDYAVYFFTLMIGVSVFYVFNAISTQAAFMKVSSNTRDIIRLMVQLMSQVSVFVSGVLGLLIVYASRFLMKRRSREFALYLILGMGKGRISAILFIETLLIGIGSLGVGLVAGMGLSQLMSALVADLFEADMASYKFVISGEAVVKTVICFGIMYLVVIIFSGLMISRCKLIDLMNSGKRSEKIPMKSPALCVIVFIAAAAALGYAYYQVGWNTYRIDQSVMLRYVIVGTVSTFLIFWSAAGLMLRIVMSRKRSYYKGLNSFTFRQISSKINTTVTSMTVICLMLFLTICALAASFSIRNSLNANLRELCPADVQLALEKDGIKGGEQLPDVTEEFRRAGLELTEYLPEYALYSVYAWNGFDTTDFFGTLPKDVREKLSIPKQFYNVTEEFISVSDYNSLMKLYGKQEVSLGSDEYILLCNYEETVRVRNEVLRYGGEINISGSSLRPKYSKCLEGAVLLAAQPINTGIFIVPDRVTENLIPSEELMTASFFTGNYGVSSKKEKAAAEEKFMSAYQAAAGRIDGYTVSVDSRIDISESAVGLGALMSLIGLYVGMVFLVTCGAILALKELSESADSVHRYETLRRIGADEKEICGSLFRQTGIFFLLPLLLACIHSIFGMKFAMVFLEVFGTNGIPGSVIGTSVILAAIYGGYFLITYFCSKSIIKGQNGKRFSP